MSLGKIYSMSILLNCEQLSKSFGSRSLFHGLSFSVFSNDKIGLIGPNGSGKTTLLKILAGLENQDSGLVTKKRELKIGYVPQSCDFPDVSPEKILLDVLKNEPITDEEKELRIKTWLNLFGFSGSGPSAAYLSGGWKKRLSLVQELIRQPDLLLLDEPTNHLDLEGIIFLEKFLSKKVMSYVLVSHDRYFLQNTASRIVEISSVYPKGIFAVDGSYQNFLEKKSQFLEGQLTQERAIASKARKEEKWLSQSPKARTTKSQSRVDEANRILEELSKIKQRNRQQITQVDFETTDRQTRKLVTAKNLSKRIKERTLFSHLDFILSPKTRMGLIGPNGSGKTTLLKIINGEVMADAGTLKKADDLKIIYFDQHKTKLPLDLTLKEALSPNGDFVRFRGKEIHVNGWCKRFLFSPDLLDMPIGKLSGGERARISIAHLLLQPADILLLDEPTNDLDIPTLEALEESLLEFPGAIVLITHDRCMIDRICNVILPLGDLETPALFADYDQWENSKKNVEQKKEKVKKEPLKKQALSYSEKKEYETIEKRIEKLEEEAHALNHLMEDSKISKDHEELEKVCKASAIVENEIEQLYLRWYELEKKLKGS